MSAEFYLYSLLLIPLLAGRAMITIFGSALSAYLVQYPKLFDFLGYHLNIDATGLLTGMPEWMQQPWFLALSFVLAIVERAISRSPELQDIWNMSEASLKGLFAFILCYMLVQGDPLLLVEHIEAEGLTNSFQGFLSVEYVWSFVVGCLTWFLSRLRSGVYTFLIDLDESDDLGLRAMLGRVESAMGVLGPLIFIIVPGLALVAAALSLLIILLLKLWVNSIGKKHHRPCGDCDHSNHLSALHCGQCNKQFADANAVGFMGLSKKNELVGDLVNHKFDLLRVGRCPNCAESNSTKSVDAQCEACHQKVFKTDSDAKAYIGYTLKRLKKTILVTAIAGFIPIVGLIPGIIFYKLHLVAGLRNYVPRASGFFIRLLIRILFIFLIMFQVTPILGFIAIPIMALANYALYTRAIKKQIRANKWQQINL